MYIYKGLHASDQPPCSTTIATLYLVCVPISYYTGIILINSNHHHEFYVYTMHIATVQLLNN